MKAETTEFDLTGLIIALVRSRPGVTAAKAAELLGVDKRTVLGRARDCEMIEVTGGRRGRGHSWRLELNGDGTEESS